MRVLMVHNFYGSAAPSGENQVFEAEKALLQKNGHKVFEYTRHSDEIRAQGVIGMLRGAAATPWNPWGVRAIKREVERLRPDVVHVHNTFPLISPAIFHAVGSKAARVLTLHNYRLFCPAAIPMRAGKTCTECLEARSVLPAVRHGCYRGSRLATVPLAGSVALHRALGTWTNQVDAFIALSDFQRVLMAEAGLPLAKVHVKPNFYPGRPAVHDWSGRRQAVVFAGRLTAEKGVRALLDAWCLWGSSAPELRILGDGELRSELKGLAARNPQVPIRFLGQLPSADAQQEIAHSRLLVLPSEWFEGFPMVVREAFAFGTPAAVSDIGPLPSIVQHGENGLVFKPGDPLSILNVVRTAWQDEGGLERLAAAARRSFESLYNEEANYRMLIAVYRQAIGDGRQKGLDS